MPPAIVLSSRRPQLMEAAMAKGQKRSGREPKKPKTKPPKVKPSNPHTPFPPPPGSGRSPHTS
jgi:hypothetical protein